MSNKSFKSEYNGYMKDIKPSKELIEKTLMLAHQEQEGLQRSKVQKSYKALHKLNLKKYTALACTLIFAIFAVKLWSDQSKEDIPSIPSESLATELSTTDTTTDTLDTTYETSTDTHTQPSTTLDTTHTEHGVVSSSESVDMATQSESVTVSSTAEDVSSTSANTSASSSVSATTESESSAVVTAVPVLDSTTTTEHSTNNESMNTTQTTQTTHTSTTTTTSQTTQTSTSTSVSTTHSNSTSSTTTTTTKATTHATTITTTPATIVETTAQETVFEPEPTVPNLGDDANEIVPPADEEMAVVTTTIVGIQMPLVTTTAEDVDSSAPLSRYGAYSIVLPDGIAGFAYNGNVLQGRIKNYFSFGDSIECIIPMGTYESTSDCYAIVVVKLDGLSTISTLKEIQECQYCTYVGADYFSSYVANLDFNQDGVSAYYDDEDKQTLLDRYIDID